MTVQSDLKKAVAAAESAKGTYLMAAESTEDQTAKSTYQQMSQEMDKHVSYLNSRLSYLGTTNTLNQQQTTTY